MTRSARLASLLAGMMTISFDTGAAPPSTAAAPAPEIPDHVFREWLLYNNAGWMYLERGNYAMAEQKFHAAIRAVWFRRRHHPRLLARTSQ